MSVRAARSRRLRGRNNVGRASAGRTLGDEMCETDGGALLRESPLNGRQSSTQASHGQDGAPNKRYQAQNADAAT